MSGAEAFKGGRFGYTEEELDAILANVGYTREEYGEMLARQIIEAMLEDREYTMMVIDYLVSKQPRPPIVFHANTPPTPEMIKKHEADQRRRSCPICRTPDACAWIGDCAKAQERAEREKKG